MASDSWKKLSHKDLIRTVPAGELKLFQELPKAHEREGAIIASALIENSLKRSIIIKLGLNDKREEALFGDFKMLSTFAARITFAWAAGIIGEKRKQDLEIIKKVRNTFAHSPYPVSFAIQAMHDSCADLTVVDSRNWNIPGEHDLTSAKGRYHWAAMLMWALISAQHDPDITPDHLDEILAHLHA